MDSQDVERFFAEQDRIMALPDEDVNKYLQRMASSRRSSGHAAKARHHNLPISAAHQPEIPDLPNFPNVVSAVVSVDVVEPFRPDLPTTDDELRCVNQSVKRPRDPSSEPSDIKRRRLSQERSSYALSGLHTPRIARTVESDINTNYAIGFPAFDLPLRPASPTVKSNLVTDTFSFPKDLPDAPLDNEDLVSDHVSLISSFSRTAEKRPRNTRFIVDQEPQLDLVPLDKASSRKAQLSKKPESGQLTRDRRSKKNTNLDLHLGDPPTFPIEDLSFSPPLVPPLNRPQQRKLFPEPSKLYLEVKERIAKHTSMKKRDKIVKINKKSSAVEPAPTALMIDDSSLIYVSSSPSPRPTSPAPIQKLEKKGRSTVDLIKQEKGKTKTKTAKGKKEKPKPMTPTEYAQYLNTKSSTVGEIPHRQRKSSSTKFLEGRTIFYTGGDMSTASETTRGRMDIIVRHGGNLVPVFDPNLVTHIITDAPIQATLRALALKHSRDIPDHIPTVKWSWVTSGISRASHLSKEEMDEKLQADLWQHAAFSNRLEAGMQIHKSFNPGSVKGKGRAEHHSVLELRQQHSSHSIRGADQDSEMIVGDEADVIDEPGALPSPPASPIHAIEIGTASSSKHKLDSDPLAEFYEKAKAERDDDDLCSGESDDADESDFRPIPKPRKRGWTCDKKEVQKGDCVNQDIIDKLSELMELHKAKLSEEDRWRAFSYSKAIRTLRHYPQRIKSYVEARTIRGIGDKTARKIAEIMETGDLRRIGYERTDDVQSTQLFQGIYGVGQSIAYQWYAAGCRTLDDIKNGKCGVKLSSVQEIGLRFYDDINDRMPRSEAKAIYELIKPIALALDPKLFIEIMGSYRRGKATCGDIDIMITRSPEDGRTHSGVLSRLLHELHSAGILTEDLALPEDPKDLEAIYRGLCRLPHVEGSKRRRIDFLTIPWTSRGAALLYYTGDDIFNRAMRMKANVLGYSLNQKGLFGNVVRDPRDRRIKLHDGEIVASETEEEIFKILGVPWQEPHERVRG